MALPLPGQDAALIEQFLLQVDREYEAILTNLGGDEPDLCVLARRYQQAHGQDYFHSQRGEQVRQALMEAFGGMDRYAVDDQNVAALIREAEYHADHVRQGLPDHIPYPAPSETPSSVYQVQGDTDLAGYLRPRRRITLFRCQPVASNATFIPDEHFLGILECSSRDVRVNPARRCGVRHGPFQEDAR